MLGPSRLLFPRLGVLALLGAIYSLQLARCHADDPAPKAESTKTSSSIERYIRIVEKNDAPAAMQTSVQRFIPNPGTAWAKQGVTVDLIGAVHVGEKEYYQELNRIFKGYDAMLYELVAPEGTVIPKGGGKRGASPISALQGGMKELLSLEFQLEKIDYTKANFVHADMTPAEMSKSMKDRGESVLSMLFKMMGAGFAQQARGKTNDVEVLMALFAPDRSVRLKRIMAKQVTDLETLNSALAGKDGSSTLIGERNRKALAVLKREVEQQGRRRVAIFYGAGHLTDFERRLEKEFAMKPSGDPRWLTAWDLTK